MGQPLRKPTIAAAVLIGVCFRGSQAADAVVLPAEHRVILKQVARLGPGPNKENSGIVKSRQFPDLFWMHNDSGDEPRVYPIRRNGTNYASARGYEQPGVLIAGAINVDWEDITVDSAGHLIVADVGNNRNDRRDLVVYYLQEPSPLAGRTAIFKKYFVRYPDQKDFPATRDQFNFDCEGVFTVDNTLFMLSKNRSNTLTTLYRLDNPRQDEVNTLTKLDSFDVKGQAVGADCSPDGLRLVVITYDAIWLFSRKSRDQSFFDADVSWGQYASKQIEAVCFADDDKLLMADEQLGELFEVSIADLIKVRAFSPVSAR
jgi:hypothetical protein